MLRRTNKEMQKDEYLLAYKHVISMERLVGEVKGLQTPDTWYEIKHYAINKATRWEAYVEGMTELSVVNRVEWCEVFLEDLQLLHQHTITFEKSMVKKGADLEHCLGSQEHEHKKLHMLLYKGENAVFSEDVCEDVLLRSARRLRTLINWAHEACMRLHTALTERQRTICVVPETPPVSPDENQLPICDLFTPPLNGKRTWGQMLCGDGQPVITLPEPKVTMRRLT